MMRIKLEVWQLSLFGALAILAAFCLGKWKAQMSLETVAKVALVVDDLGYNTRDIDELFEIGSPLTLGILPRLNYSLQIARRAEKMGFEILLHLPLEPHDESKRPGLGVINTTMGPDEVKRILCENLGSVSHVRGISNHMGSKATEDEDLMRLIFSQMKQPDLYFLDSLVTTRSVCQELARSVGIGFIQRDVFLDNVDEPDYIKGQIRQLARVAHRRGKAVGICHLKPITLAVLKEMIPQLEEEGIKFVYVSELVE